MSEIYRYNGILFEICLKPLAPGLFGRELVTAVNLVDSFVHIRRKNRLALLSPDYACDGQLRALGPKIL